MNAKHTSGSSQSSDPPLIFLTGATGYVGGRLLQSLEKDGYRIRCLARRPEFLTPRVAQFTQVVEGDVLDRHSLESALQGVRVSYYLIHSMGAAGSFEENDRKAAANFADAAKKAGVERIIYLGGLGEEQENLSPHLRSRQEVGEILRGSGIVTVEFRASIIIGSGSLSFEMIRSLVERLPVMVTPRWVRVPAQPIFIGDVLRYLRSALDMEFEKSTLFEIGGPDVVSYGELMKEYARSRGLHRVMIPVPVLTPRLSSLWLGLVTPLYARVGKKLVDSIRHPTVVKDNSALEVFSFQPLGVGEAIAQALRNEDYEFAQTRWSDAVSAAKNAEQWGGVRWGNRLMDVREIIVRKKAEESFTVIEKIGGKTGWYYANWLWVIRGWIDLLVGGVGMRRGRKHPARLSVGDVVDCWRVEAIEPGHRLSLKAEMKLPGRAWLDFTLHSEGSGTKITQTAVFDPIGLSGLIYWYGVWPLHQFVFTGMLRGIARAIEVKQSL